MAGDIIYLARKARGFTQRELARVSGVGQPKISAYERHAVQPTFEIVERLVGHCGMRLAVDLEDNSSPTLPDSYDFELPLTIQWALNRGGSRFGLLDVRLVLPWSASNLLLLANFGWPSPEEPERESGRESNRRAQALQRFLTRFVDEVAVIDLAEVADDGRQTLLRASVPLAVIGRPYAPRETRRMPLPPDERWYATRLLDPTPLHGPPAPQFTTTLPNPRSVYRRAVLEEEKRDADRLRRRIVKEALWRKLDTTKSHRLDLTAL